VRGARGDFGGRPRAELVRAEATRILLGRGRDPGPGAAAGRAAQDLLPPRHPRARPAADTALDSIAAITRYLADIRSQLLQQVADSDAAAAACTARALAAAGLEAAELAAAAGSVAEAAESAARPAAPAGVQRR
jgi:hypothetical protein